MRWLERYSEHAYLLLRVVAGILFACHGAQKLFGAFGATPASGGLMTLGGVIELAGGLGIAIGLGTRVLAFLASGMMAVAYFKAHAPGGLWPIVNHGELAMLYCFLFLYIASRGAGRWGVDAKLGRRAPAAR